MDATADELAGVVDLFGGLTRGELERALAEAAFRADGASVEEAALEEAIADALGAFALVRYDPTADGPSPEVDEPLLVAGPTAFPRVPEYAEDVPHILDVDRRRLDREALGERARERLATAVAEAVEETDDADEPHDRERLRHLLEVSYDVEAWAPVDAAAERARLEAALEGG